MTSLILLSTERVYLTIIKFENGKVNFSASICFVNHSVPPGMLRNKKVFIVKIFKKSNVREKAPLT